MSIALNYNCSHCSQTTARTISRLYKKKLNFNNLNFNNVIKSFHKRLFIFMKNNVGRWKLHLQAKDC